MPHCRKNPLWWNGGYISVGGNYFGFRHRWATPTETSLDSWAKSSSNYTSRHFQLLAGVSYFTQECVLPESETRICYICMSIKIFTSLVWRRLQGEPQDSDLRCNGLFDASSVQLMAFDLPDVSCSQSHRAPQKNPKIGVGSAVKLRGWFSSSPEQLLTGLWLTAAALLDISCKDENLHFWEDLKKINLFFFPPWKKPHQALKIPPPLSGFSPSRSSGV